MSAPAAFMSIGDVLTQLRPDFPDITISKIRFLEDKGLVEPERSPSGYRKYSRADIGRLRYVLQAQRDHYLPLRVIRDNLDALDRGMEPPQVAGAAPRMPRTLVAADTLPGPESFARDTSELRLTREELLQASGLTADQLQASEQHNLITELPGGWYAGDAVVVGRAVAQMSGFGLEPRHLRGFRAAADREVGLVEQLVSPLVHQRSPEARARAEELANELASVAVRLHASLVKQSLRSGLLR